MHLKNLISPKPPIWQPGAPLFVQALKFLENHFFLPGVSWHYKKNLTEDLSYNCDKLTQQNPACKKDSEMSSSCLRICIL